MAGALRFDLVRVTRMPGFRHTGFQLTDLSPGINIVHGPNGSGKTTSANAIEALLWPRTATALRPSVGGVYRLGSDEWSVEVEYDRAVHQRNGITADPPVLPAAEERDRYRLSLHELLGAESNARFAQAILREAAGGYDLEAARGALPSASAASTRSAEFRALRDAIVRRDAAREHQRELLDQERGLGMLRVRQAAATEAQKRAEVLTAAMGHATARDAEARAREAFGELHPAFEAMHGDEADRMRLIAADLATIGDETTAATAALADAEAAVRDAALPDSGVDASFLTGLRDDLETLRQLERKLEDRERERDGQHGRRGEAAGQIAGAAEDGKLAEIDAGTLRELTEFAGRAGRASQRVDACRARIGALDVEGRAADDVEREIERVGAAERCLRQWLNVPGGPAPADVRTRGAALSAGGVLIVLGLVLASTSLAALLLSVLGVAVVAVALLRRHPGTDDRERLQAEYPGSEVPPPEAWETEAVLRRLHALADRRAAATLARERALRREQHVEELAEAEREVAELDTEGGAVAVRLGVSPQVDPAQLVWLAYRIADWQAANAALAAAEAAVEATREHANVTREALRTRLRPFSDPPLDTVGDLAAAIHRLADRREKRDTGLREIARARALLTGLSERRRKCGDSALQIYQRCGVPEHDVSALQRRCDEFPAYRAARKTLDDRELALRFARERLEALEAEPALLDAQLGDIQAQLDEAVAGAASLRQISDEVTRIETRVDDAKKIHDIEGCNEQVERCQEALRELRERETRGVVAEHLAAAVRSATETEHLPAVFHRAREIFGRITRGRYTLRFTGTPEPEFLAFDNQARQGLTLDELSSGTRVQLLLAVRVAFVDTQEGEARLPLVLDEVLGNSDDERAGAIMEAVMELAREGRQIFYLTAQHDEVLKWRDALEAQGDVKWRLIDLAESRRLQRPLRMENLRIAPAPRVPDPGELSHAEYASRLGVPGIDPYEGHAGALHLWYLVDDPRELHRLLLAGAEHWGELEVLAGVAGGVVVEEAGLARTAALARAADAWLAARRIGAGLRVDRGVLLEAKGVTPSFLDRVDELCRELGGDARALIAAIEAGELKGFRANQAALFREYLESEGYLDSSEPLTAAEARGRALGSVAPEIELGVVTLPDVDALIRRLHAATANG